MNNLALTHSLNCFSYIYNKLVSGFGDQHLGFPLRLDAYQITTIGMLDTENMFFACGVLLLSVLQQEHGGSNIYKNIILQDSPEFSGNITFEKLEA